MLEMLQKASKVAFVIAGLIFGGLYYWSNSDSLSSKEAAIEAKKNELEAAEAAIQSAKKIAGDKAKFEEESTKVSDQLKAAIEFLPTKLNEQDILTKIANEARSAGVRQTSVQPKKAQPKGFYEELQMDVELEGSYSQLVLFLSYISNIQRIVNIKGLDLRIKDYVDETPILRLKGTLVAYRYTEKTAGATK